MKKLILGLLMTVAFAVSNAEAVFLGALDRTSCTVEVTGAQANIDATAVTIMVVQRGTLKLADILTVRPATVGTTDIQ